MKNGCFFLLFVTERKPADKCIQCHQSLHFRKKCFLFCLNQMMAKFWYPVSTLKDHLFTCNKNTGTMLHVGTDPLIVVGSKCFSFVENKTQKGCLLLRWLTLHIHPFRRGSLEVHRNLIRILSPNTTVLTDLLTWSLSVSQPNKLMVKDNIYRESSFCLVAQSCLTVWAHGL